MKVYKHKIRMNGKYYYPVYKDECVTSIDFVNSVFYVLFYDDLEGGNETRVKSLLKLEWKECEGLQESSVEEISTTNEKTMEELYQLWNNDKEFNHEAIRYAKERCVNKNDIPIWFGQFCQGFILNGGKIKC
jgi:hypothetical protein